MRELSTLRFIVCPCKKLGVAHVGSAGGIEEFFVGGTIDSIEIVFFIEIGSVVLLDRFPMGQITYARIKFN
jgi:hypothetical protein